MNLTLKKKKKLYCAVQVSNNRPLNTLITVHREIGTEPPPPKKKKKKKKKAFTYCAHRQR